MIREALNAFVTVQTSDPDDARRRKLLNVILSGLTLVALLATVLALVSPAASPRLPLLGLILILSNGIIYAINRYFSGRLAAGIFLLLLVLIISFGDSPVEVVQGRTLFFLSVPILAASILMPPATSFLVAAVSSGLSAYLSGQADIPVNTIGILGFFTVAFGAWLSARSLETALRELRSVNRELDQRVDERTRELGAANVRLKELDRMKSKFVSDVSHELRTPISNLRIYLDILEDGSRSDQRERYMAVLREETDRLTTLVQDILDLSQFDLYADASANGQRVDLNLIIARQVAAQEARAQAIGLELRQDLAGSPVLVAASPEQLTRIVGNLLGNAIKYTERGSVFVRTRVQGQRVELEIRDTGIGIAEEEQKHIFDRFYRGEHVSQSTIPGSGLGLAIAREIVETLGGSIRLESASGAGTTVTVNLPLASA